ncbi:MAG: tripartite tricarboxylate transporter substrate binding protein [Burkholderiales bacterium]
MKCMHLGLSALFFIAISTVTMSGAAHAQAWPAKPIRFVVPYPPGGSNDVLTRITAQAMSPGLGQQIVIDNRGGAGGMIGADNVAKSPADGYSIVNVQASFTANAAVRSKMAYDPLRDFAYLGMMARGPLLMVVHPSMPVKTVQGFIALAKAKPGQINYGSTGTGGHNHLATELFRHMAGINIVHIPYKGVAPALTDLMGGHTQLVMTSLPSAMTQVQAGRLKALAVGSEKRSSFMPELPTIGESGVRGYDAASWYLVMAPAKTPKNIIEKISTAMTKIVAVPEIKATLVADGFEPAGYSPQESAKFLQDELKKWASAISLAGIQPE